MAREERESRRSKNKRSGWRKVEKGAPRSSKRRRIKSKKSRKNWEEGWLALHLCKACTPTIVTNREW